MDILYIVAGPEYWANIPQTRQLTCGRVRFTSCRCVPPKGAGVYVLKAEAVADATATHHHRELIAIAHAIPGVRIHVADDPKLTAVICTHLEAIRARLRQRRATV